MKNKPEKKRKPIKGLMMKKNKKDPKKPLAETVEEVRAQDPPGGNPLGGGEIPKDLQETKIPDTLPVLPIRGSVIYPSLLMPFVISNEKIVKMVDETLAGNKLVAVCAQRNEEVEDPKAGDLFGIGVASVIVRMLRFPDGTIRLLVQGISRVKVTEYVREEPYLVAKVKVMEEKSRKSIEAEALVRTVSNLFQKIISLAPYLPDELQAVVMNLDDPGKLADLVASNLNLTVAVKQDLLETADPKERLKKLAPLLAKELSILELGNKLRDQVKTELDKDQREYYLREQLKAIQKELGETDERAVETNELRKKIEEAGLPPEPLKAANNELDRLAKMPPHAAEYTVSRTYLDWLVTLPWQVSTADTLDIPLAEKNLEEDHYDLEKVKQRILEFLAVRKLRGDAKGSILCFAGPPGVGKTSLGKSIARAMGRKFTRLSLGGIRDEAEIRGFRRTYVGSLPGRILQGLKTAGSNNPVFMLDEVDKIGQDFRGDPASALLEVLDPEQNNSFVDHYLDVPFDLSRVMFITTANILDPIPPALRDRMEVLELPGYIEEEKLEIAKRYLVPRQVRENGLPEGSVSFEDGALSAIIAGYTRESGVRTLERNIGTVCRKVARGWAEGKTDPVAVTAEGLHEYLGPQKFFQELAERVSEPGVATGLAWTPFGGDILFVESTKMRGKKGLILTGRLGDVMKESAQAALSYIRSKAGEFGIDEGFFEETDLHIHVPEGATPKDGPSAGVTLATSLVSLLTGRCVKPFVAMTGEITLRGRVLPVGGIKEKVIAAKRAGIKRIFLPRENEKDLEEVPEHVKKDLEFTFVDRIDEVVKGALCEGKAESKKAPGEAAAS